MSVKLSKSEITSFLGHVLPLSLISERDLSAEDIHWRAEGDAIGLRTFDKSEYGTSEGVLVILKKLGTGRVIAEFEGKEYACAVTVRERRSPAPDAKLNYYLGDLHNHTSVIHKREPFALRTTELCSDYLKQIKDEGLIDFTAISDHGDVVTERDFLRGFTDDEASEPSNVVVLPGSESEATVISTDRYGIMHKVSGEAVVINADSFSAASSWEEFCKDFENSPLPIGTFAHPQVLGFNAYGMWNPHPEVNNTPDMLRIMKLIEMGDGTTRHQNLLHEYTYSAALDYGFRVSPTCSSDSHGPVWGFYACPGKTVIMAEEKSKEAFIDALANNRVYATESGNVKLRYTVNGNVAPCDLSPDVTDYRFDVSLSFFRDDPATHPVRCELISNGGVTLLDVNCAGKDSFGFEVSSRDAIYFYLRLTDSIGQKTWSTPVFCGRAPMVNRDSEYTPLRQVHFTAVNEQNYTDAGILLNDKVEDFWSSDTTTASILIDLGNVFSVGAVGHYAPRAIRGVTITDHMHQGLLFSRYVGNYRISVSLDGVNYRTVKEGVARVFGSEELLTFDQCLAKYLRFEVLSTVGARSGRAMYAEAKPAIGELTLFSRQES